MFTVFVNKACTIAAFDENHLVNGITSGSNALKCDVSARPVGEFSRT